MTEAFTLTDTQRAAAIDRAEESVALLSGAGCGKTFVLARRFAELLRRREDQPDALRRLVAVTFTDKAAMEMAQRVRAMLADFAKHATGGRRARLLQWLDELPEARISTIHSLCASLLRSCAIDAGVDPAFAVASDDLLCDALAAEAADQAVLSAVEAGDEDLARLLGRDRYDSVVAYVQTLLDHRTTCDLADYADPAATLARWQAQLQADGQAAWARLGGDSEFAEELADLAAAACSDPGDKLLARRDGIVGAIQAMLADPAARTPANFAEVTASVGGVGSAKAWGKDMPKAVRHRLKALVAPVEELEIYAQPLGELDEAAAAALAVLARLAAEADRLYAAKKRARGVLDFTDLLAAAHRLLATRPALRKALADQIDQLLIDECQDTDDFQVSLLRMLADGDDTGHVPPGRLFVVGDAKQSIYRFRGAQVEVFDALCDSLGPGARENLDLSFRTHAAGVAFVNHLFAPLMGSAYTPIRAHREQAPPHPAVEILLAAEGADYPLGLAAEKQRAQAALTAQRIREMLDNEEKLVWDRDAETWRPVRRGDIAILMARMTHSLDYERELQVRGIDYYVVAGTGFFQQQEVYDVLNALRVIDNPFDDVALAGVLRSALFGLDDNVLAHLARTHQPPYLPGLDTTLLADRLTPDQQATLAAAAALLDELHRAKDALGLDTVLERLLAATGYEATLLARFHGQRALGNVRMLLDRARGAAAEGISLAAFVAQMSEMVLSESRYEQAAVAAEDADVVRLMTVHKAKGLEFPVVFLPDLNAGRRGAAETLLHRQDWQWTYRAAPAPSDGEAAADAEQRPVSWQAAALRERADEQRESLRQLYVALTRHEDHLVLVGADARTKEGHFTTKGSWLDQIDDVLALADHIDQGGGEATFGENAFRYLVGAVAPQAARASSGPPTPGRQILSAAKSGADVARRILRLADDATPAPPLLGAIPEDAARVELAVTALGDFSHCPMLYRWRYELGVPPPAPVGSGPATGAPPPPPTGGALPPATLGTLLHRCMELLDVAAPQPPATLVRQAVAEMELDQADPADLAAMLAPMQAAFLAHPLCGQLRDARHDFRELDFVLDLAPITLRGQIDLLMQEAGGAWHVVDYKSDRVGPDHLAEHAARYELQMLIYAAATARHVGEAPARATLYFLRPAQTHEFEFTSEALASAEDGVRDLARRLIRSRRTANFERAEAGCEGCPYAKLCDPPPQDPLRS